MNLWIRFFIGCLGGILISIIHSRFEQYLLDRKVRRNLKDFKPHRLSQD